MMTRNDRRAIVFMALALSGAQIPGILNQARPSRAACPDIGQVIQNYRPGALNEWAEQAGAEAREAMGGEVERRPYYEEKPQAAVERPISMAAVPQSIETGDPVADRLDREIAAANGMTLAAYKANPEKARL